MAGKKTDGSNGAHTNLTIKCINGIDVPADDDQMSALAKTMATLIKASLKDPKQFESFTVVFVQKTTDGGKTTSSNVGHEFQPGEIK